MKQYTEYMDGIQASDTLHRRLLNLEAPKRRPLGLARAALIAACLCFALVGTAMAGIAGGWIRVSSVDFYPNINVNGTKSSYSTVEIRSDGTVYIPFERFSQEAQEFAHSFTYLPQYKSFDSWDEVEQFLGVSIADNPVLDQMEIFPNQVQDRQYGTKTDKANFIVQFDGRMDTPTIRTSAIYRLEAEDNVSFRLIVSGTITTESLGTEERISGHTFNDTQQPVTETYVTPSGLQAVISTARLLDDGHSLVCNTSFQLNGAYFTLFAFESENPDQVVPAIKKVLDAYS